MSIIERSRVLQAMDKFGYVPGLGMGIGALRMSGSMIGLFMAAIGSSMAVFCGDKTYAAFEEKCNFFVTRCFQEFNRGLAELVPVIPVSLIIDCEQSDKEKNGGYAPGGIAYGRYICVASDCRGRFAMPQSNYFDVWGVERDSNGERVKKPATSTATSVTPVADATLVSATNVVVIERTDKGSSSA